LITDNALSVPGMSYLTNGLVRTMDLAGRR